MLKRLKTVSMMLFLLGTSTGAAYAISAPEVDDVKITQQSGTATGTVVDAMGPVIGASVVVKGTTNGIITDFDGNFSLSNVKKGDILVISFVGYTTQEVKWEGTPLTLTLKEDTQTLEEVVVLGYGVKQKRGKLTNSVSKVNEETLTVGSYGDPAQALVGAVSGVKVHQTSGFAGSTPSITLRGGTGYDGSGSPLVIVDGQLRSDGLSDLNPNDIESMDILKDAGATAIYGARAANGVILVTTKSGKQGKAQINFNTKIGLQYYNSPYEMVDAYGYLYWLRTAIQETPWASQGEKNKLFASNSAQPHGIGDTELTKYSKYNILKYTGSEYQQDLINKHGWSVMDDPVSDNQILYKDTQIQDFNVQSPALSQEYNLSFSGGNDRGKYYAGLGYYDAEGLGYGTYYTRYSFSLNGSYKITDWLESTSTFNYNRANWLANPLKSTRGDSYMFGRLETTPPTVRLMDENGNHLLGVSIDDSNFQFQTDTRYKDDQSDKFNMTQSLEATLFKGFKVKGTMAWSYSESVSESFNKDQYTNQENTNISKDRYSYSGFNRTFNQTYNIVATYDGQFGDHAVNAMAGMEYWDKSYRMLAADGREAPTDDFMDLEYTSKLEGKRGINTEHTRERILSYFGRAQYDYKGRYIVAFTFREDGYSRLLNNRWGFFPGVSGGWVASEEKFYEPLKDIVNYAKVRASYGVNGNVSGIGIYDLHGKYGRSTTYNNNVGYTLATLPNPNLRWEKTRTAEIGLDLGFLNNKYTLGFTYYNRVTLDKYATLTFPATTGWSGITNNNGELRNRGIEIDVHANLLNRNGFTWTVTGNIAYNKNTVLKLPYNGVDRNRQGGTEIYTGNGDETYFVGGRQEGLTPGNVIVGFLTDKMIRSEADLAAYEGYADMSISGRPAVYYGESGLKKLRDAGYTGTAYELAPGDLTFKDINGDGIIKEKDRAVIGTYTPKWNGGLSSTLKWKGLTLYLRTDFGLGFSSYDGLRQWIDGCAQGAYAPTTRVWDTWTPDNPGAKYPKYVWADFLGKNNWNRESDFWITKGNYLAFREIQLSYTLPKTLIQKFNCENLTLSVTGQNLGYWTNAATPIPDHVQYTSGTTGGYGGTNPLPLTLLFGLNVTF